MNSSPSFSVICPNLSENASGRGLLLAELLSKFGAVQLVGIRTRELWPPLKDVSIPIISLPVNPSGPVPVFLEPATRRWLRHVTANTIPVVVKPLAHSLGLTLAAGFRPSELILDIDDWEVGFVSPELTSLNPINVVAKLHDAQEPRQYLSVTLMAYLAYLVPTRIVSNQWLFRKYGGEILYHVRDLTRIRPQKSEPSDHSRVWVGFIGTIRPHKGVDLLIRAIERVNSLSQSTKVGLILAGANPKEAYARKIIEQATCTLDTELLELLPPFPWSELPAVLARPDIIAIPSITEASTAGQIPAKLFDALAAGKPILATDVNDISEILTNDAGLVVPPGDVEALVNAIQKLSQDGSFRSHLGENARHIAEKNYSYKKGREVLSRTLFTYFRTSAK